MITLAGQVILSGFSFISWEDVKMAEKLSFDTGIREYEINDNGILRFNPSDPNVTSDSRIYMRTSAASNRKSRRKAREFPTVWKSLTCWQSMMPL